MVIMRRLSRLLLLASIGWGDALAYGQPSPSGLSPDASVQSASSARVGRYVVSPDGPRDGGDFGPHTPNTRTSGLQEAFDACRRDRRDLYIVGGAVPAPFKNPGGVYTLDETLRIPWMQDFRCDGGEAVLQYNQPSGDAVVVDSQMSCVYKFGLIALKEGAADGACLRIKPQTAGPDRLVGVVASRFAVNALVGGGSRGLEEGTFTARGDGLVLDSSEGGVANNEYFIHEILGCNRGIYLTAPSSQSAVLNNWLRCPFAHICQTHLRLGDPSGESGILWNRIEAFIDGDRLEQSQGAQIFGRGNRLTLGFLRVGDKSGVVFEQGARDNLVETQNLQGRYADRAHDASNRIRSQERDGLRVQTPDFPPSGAWISNHYPATIEVSVLSAGDVTEWERREQGLPAVRFVGPLFAGQSLTLRPQEQLRFTYRDGAAWNWRVLEP
jgi:hypothetical protein